MEFEKAGKSKKNLFLNNVFQNLHDNLTCILLSRVQRSLWTEKIVVYFQEKTWLDLPDVSGLMGFKSLFCFYSTASGIQSNWMGFPKVDNWRALKIDLIQPRVEKVEKKLIVY